MLETRLNLLERYIAVATLKALGLVSVGLTSLFSLLELITQLHDVGKGHYRLIDAIVYVLLTAPARLLLLMPAAILFACLFALGALANRAELTAMAVGGMSQGRIIGAVFKLAAGVVVVMFLVAQFVIPPAQRFAQTHRATRLSTVQAVRSGDSFWAAGDRQFLNVQRFENGNSPSDIHLYEFAAGGELQRLVQADRAELRPDGTWLLQDVLSRRFMGTHIERDQLSTLEWHSFLQPKQVSVLILPADSMQPIQLFQYVRDLERRHQPATRYAQDLWAKINLPLAMAAMILIAAPFVFGSARSQSTGMRLMIGTLIGIIFALAEQITTYLGLLWNLSPALTATAPSIVLMAAAFYLFRRRLG